MVRIRDFRPDAVKLALIVNERGRREGNLSVVELDTDEFVHIHCGNVIFIVFRDVITAGSMYFESSLFGFFKEAYSQEITFDEDVDSEALELYLNLTHSWFFEIRYRGIRVVPVDYFKSFIEPIQEEPFKRAHLEIPKLKLGKLAEVVALADRFLHRSLLCILRQMFLALLNITHTSWDKVKKEARDMDVLYHTKFVIDYMDAFRLLSMGHDDEKFLRDALTESFYWLTLNTPDLRKRFFYLMSDDFVTEWNQDRRGHSETEKITHARGIFATDQYCYESVTRLQKQRRFKRVVNMCPFEDQKDVFPWFENPQDRRIRVSRLHASVRSIKCSARKACHRAIQFNSLVPDAIFHQSSTVNSSSQIPAGDGNRWPANTHTRGGGLGRGRGRHHGRDPTGGHYQQFHGSLHQDGPDHLVDPESNRDAQKQNAGYPSIMNDIPERSGAMNSALPSNQVIQGSSAGVHTATQTFKRPSQMHLIISDIQALLSTGRNDTLHFLQKPGKSQSQTQSPKNEAQSTQTRHFFQPSQVGAPKIQQSHFQQPQSQQMIENYHQVPPKKRNKYKKKKQNQMPATEDTGSQTPGVGTRVSFLLTQPQAEGTPQDPRTGGTDIGGTKLTGDAKHGGDAACPTHNAIDSAVQPHNHARNKQHEYYGDENGNGHGGRSRHRRRGRNHGRAKAHEHA
ncbi:hypothetical protein CT0861_02325 [Colletotrichum tofieldiae]|uniref:BTB domain-containing protein n=1 Tax=Colletotrichum tofieldiae TaxID=708197 RepID=A0A161VPR8_9PEZI|nr:hypothetical protein CT0861_02325 [Colletotrichum tofieldiae]